MTDILQGDVKVPMVGKTKKWVIYGVGGLAAGYVAWKWYSNGTADVETDDGMYTTDDLSEYGRSTGGGSLNVGGNNGSTVTDGTSPDVIDSNSEWTQKAVEVLSQAGYDPAVVFAALGEFLARRALDPSEATIARAAIAAVGMPPEGRPWSVIEEASTGTGTLPAPRGLAVKGVTTNSVTLGWSRVDGAGSYKIYKGGSVAATVTSTTGTVTGLAQGTSYSFAVAAVSTSGKTGAKSGSVTGKTTASSSSTPPKNPSTKTPPYRTVIARRGDTISKIAARYGKSWQEVWNFNLKYRSASTVKTLKSRGPNLIYAGTRIWVPK